MTYTLSNTCAKIFVKTLLVQLIIKNVITCYLEHSVYLYHVPFSCYLTLNNTGIVTLKSGLEVTQGH